MLRQLDGSIQRANQTVLHDARYSHGAANLPGEVGLHRLRRRIGWHV
jgi:hypothetical protein